ncbi:MAG: hypothetical protein QF502_05825 [Nitrospinaceae bacterium]|nr:hypothetical protein [Nitrospinaceae bacterium]
MPTDYQDHNFNDDPFTGPSEWYPYHCCACQCKMWVEDIVVDAFPSNGPGNCPIIICPECGKDFVRAISEQSIMSETDPNVSP